MSKRKHESAVSISTFFTNVTKKRCTDVDVSTPSTPTKKTCQPPPSSPSTPNGQRTTMDPKWKDMFKWMTETPDGN